MGISDRNYDSRLSFGNKVNSLILLIAISMIIFVVLAFFRAVTYLRLPEGGDVVSYFDNNILSWFAVPAKLTAVLDRPWTILTHAFVHLGVWQQFANMLWLWCFGYIFIDLTGNRKLIPVFLYGALAGVMGYLLACNFLPALSTKAVVGQYFGAGAGILAIGIAATTISPNYKLFPFLNGGISLWIITALYAIIDLATIPASNPAAHIAHLAGGLAGFLFIFLLRKGIDGSGWMNSFYDWAANLFNPDKPKKGQEIKQTLFYKAGREPFKKTLNLTQKRLDDILDKINISGFNSLSDEEKELLKRASQEDLRDR